MNVKKVEVREVILTDFNQEKGRLGFEITFENQEPSIKVVFDFNTPEELTRRILSAIKRNKTPEDTDDDAPDFLKDYLALIIVNQEELEVSLVRSFTYLIQRYKNMKKTTSATEYMRIYNQFRTIREVLFDRTRIDPREGRLRKKSD